MNRRGSNEIAGRVFIGSMVLILIAFGVIFGMQSGWAAEKTINWVWSHGITIPGSEYEKAGYIDWPKRVLEATNGRLVIKPLIGTYDPARNLYDARDGRCEGATVTLPYYGATVPSFCWANVPGLVQTNEEHKKTYAALKDKFGKVVDAQGVKLLFYGMFSEITIPTNRPIRKVEDFKGLKIRIATLTTGQLLESMGASAMTIPLSEVYMAAQRGVVDGMDASLPPLLKLKFYEVMKYAIVLPLGHPAIIMVVNKKAFEGLPKDLQEAVIRVGRELEEEFWGRVAAESKSIYAELAQKGLIFTQMPPEEMNRVFEMAKPVQEKWLQLQGPEITVRKEILDTVKKTIGK